MENNQNVWENALLVIRPPAALDYNIYFCPVKADFSVLNTKLAIKSNHTPATLSIPQKYTHYLDFTQRYFQLIHGPELADKTS